MVSRRRRIVFIVLAAACLAGAAVTIVLGVRSEPESIASSAAARKALLSARAENRRMVLYRSLAPKGQVAVAAAGPAAGRATFEPLSCDRVYFAAGRGLCLRRGGSLTGAYDARVFDSQLRVRHTLQVAGAPSRARVSPDGRYGAVTMFVTGHSYAAPGAFSTQTTLIDMATGAKVADLEQFTVTRGSRQVTANDVNYWGVTFARDSDRFYATLATGGKTYLIQGSVRGRVAHVIHQNVECPSLSPDGTRIAYKHRTASSDEPWRLTVLDLATMRETPLAETRSIDDQAEWLDDGHVLYGRAGKVWKVAADGSGHPEAFAAAAESPAVVRW